MLSAISLAATVQPKSRASGSFTRSSGDRSLGPALDDQSWSLGWRNGGRTLTVGASQQVTLGQLWLLIPLLSQ